MMVPSFEVTVRGGRMDAAGICVMCGDAVPAGTGFAARSGERAFRLMCGNCLARFEADPGPYLAADPARLVVGGAEESPASEWTCY